MNRTEAKQLDSEIRTHLKKLDMCVNWCMESGSVVLKRDGDVKISYSVRDENKVEAVNQAIWSFLINKGFKFQQYVYDAMHTYRPEVRLIYKIKQG